MSPSSITEEALLEAVADTSRRRVLDLILAHGEVTPTALAAEFCFIGDTIRLPTTIRLPAGALLLFSPASVARDIFNGVENGEQEIFPDPLSGTLVEGGHKAVARRSSAKTRRSWCVPCS